MPSCIHCPCRPQCPLLFTLSMPSTMPSVVYIACCLHGSVVSNALLFTLLCSFYCPFVYTASCLHCPLFTLPVVYTGRCLHWPLFTLPCCLLCPLFILPCCLLCPLFILPCCLYSPVVYTPLLFKPPCCLKRPVISTSLLFKLPCLQCLVFFDVHY